jgi:hypothetical protein
VCNRCGGEGRWIGWSQTGYVCWGCYGSGDGGEKKVRVYIDPVLQLLDDELSAIIFDHERTQKMIKWEAEREAREAAAQAQQFKHDWDEALDEDAERTRHAAQKYLGEVGEKLSIEGYVTTAFSFTNQMYGNTTLVVEVTTDDGCIVKTLGSGQSLWSAKLLKKNHTRVTFSGTIKGHEIYDGDKSTLLTRAKLTPQEEA